MEPVADWTAAAPPVFGTCPFGRRWLISLGFFPHEVANRRGSNIGRTTAMMIMIMTTTMANA